MNGIFGINLENMNSFFRNVIARSPGGTTKQSVDRGRSFEIKLSLNGLLSFARNDVFRELLGLMG